MAVERVLTARELNRALLARQLLLERSPARLPRALELVGGIQAQYAPSMYVGLWSRLAGFERQQLTRALQRRKVVQATLMRVTIHLVSRRDYWPFALATREARQALWLRSVRGAATHEEMIAAAERLGMRLEQGPLRRAELEQLLGKQVAAGVGLWIDLVRAPPSGTWERRRADLYAAADAWLGPPELSLEKSVDLLVRRYLGAFGPASRADLASWSGLGLGALPPVLERLSLRRFRDESGDELLDVARAPLPDPETPAPVRFLPTWDAALLVHARRTGLLPEVHRSKIFSTRNPHSTSTFLVDGAVAGTWRHDGDRIQITPFGRLDGATRRALAEEGERLRAFHA